jgi:predicted transcriptional regulator
LSQRYLVEGWGIDRIARSLRCRAAAVRDELRLIGIERESAQDRARCAGKMRADRNRERRAARVLELGFADAAQYLADRRARGWTQKRIATELGVGEKAVRALLRESVGGK